MYCCCTIEVENDSLFKNEITFQSYYFVLFMKEKPGGQNYPANGATMVALPINLPKSNEKPYILLGLRIIFRKD